jgi:hypothetical protein
LDIIFLFWLGGSEVDWTMLMGVLCMHRLKREVALVGERAAGFDASKVDLHDEGA